MVTNLQPKSNFPLSGLTTLRVGGPAQWLAEPTCVEEIQASIDWANNNNVESHIIGAGSNLLIHDDGLPGLTVCLRKLNGLKIDKVHGLVEAMAGEAIPSLSRRVAKYGMHGLEWSVGIPGTVGGAVVMNAGAEGNCTADWLESVRVMPRKGGESFILTRADLDFSYRYSILQNNELTLISAKFRLEPNHVPQELSQKTSLHLHNRITTQPYQFPSCGSVFRNPEPLKAGQLIEKLGLKGTRIGGAEVSSLHANFIINKGNATSNDIVLLIKLLQQQVEKHHGLYLHPEVKRLGF